MLSQILEHCFIDIEYFIKNIHYNKNKRIYIAKIYVYFKQHTFKQYILMERVITIYYFIYNVRLLFRLLFFEHNVFMIIHDLF